MPYHPDRGASPKGCGPLDAYRKTTEDAFAELAAAVEAGESERLTAFLAAMARFHRYSFGNVLLIAKQRPDATNVAGFNTWKRMGRFVRKGERGLAIIAPIVYRKDDETTEEGRSVRGFKVAHVFDVAQTEGEPLPEFASVAGDPGENMGRLKELVASRGIELQYSDSLGSAQGTSSGGIIKIATGLPTAKEFSVLVHELAHEALHHTKGEPRASKSVRETEAEAVAFVVCRAIGLDTGTAASDYIQLYSGDKDTLAESLGRIQATATEILTALAPAA